MGATDQSGNTEVLMRSDGKQGLMTSIGRSIVQHCAKAVMGWENCYWIEALHSSLGDAFLMTWFEEKQASPVDIGSDLEPMGDEFPRNFGDRPLLDVVFAPIPSAFGVRAGASDEPANAVSMDCPELAGTPKGMIAMVTSAVAAASAASALSGFGTTLARALYRVPVNATPDDLAVAAASNDIPAVGRLLGARDVDEVDFSDANLPEWLIRRPLTCSLLDVAVGSGSVEMTKYLLEFHSATATRETLKMAISTGSLELFRMMRERLPEQELRDRIDLMEVAAEFHQEGVVAWFFRDATVFERELLTVFALKGKLADTLAISFENRFRPWWHRNLEISLKWRASAGLEYVSAPWGFKAEGGWFRSKGGRELALPPVGSDGKGVWVPPRWVVRHHVSHVSLPVGVMTIGHGSFTDWSGLTQLSIPSGVTTIGRRACYGCSSLTRVELPSTVTRIGASAFEDCSSLEQLEIPSSVMTIGEAAFRDCSSLVQVRNLSGVRTIARRAFCCCRGLTHLEIPSSVTTIGEFACRHCSSLTRLEIPSNVRKIGNGAFEGCSGLTQCGIAFNVTTIGEYAFCACSGLTQLEIPASVTTIGKCAFERCSSLTQLQFPGDVANIGEGVFKGVAKLEHLTLVGSVLSSSVVAALHRCLTSTARVVGSSLSTRRFGLFGFSCSIPGCCGRFGRFAIVVA